MQVTMATAEQEIEKRKLSFDDLERETGRTDTSKWGSDASRRSRASLLNRGLGQPRRYGL